jgi:Tetracyclin repressor-like, C-terminal domain
MSRVYVRRVPAPLLDAPLIDRLAARLAGPDARLRTELALAQLLGLGVLLSTETDGAGATTDLEWIVELYAPAIQALIDSTPHPTGSRTWLFRPWPGACTPIIRASWAVTSSGAVHGLRGPSIPVPTGLLR